MRFPALWLPLVLLIGVPAASAADPPVESPFTSRGYYLTLTRTPTFGLDAWKRTIDAYFGRVEAG